MFEPLLFQVLLQQRIFTNSKGKKQTSAQSQGSYSASECREHERHHSARCQLPERNRCFMDEETEAQSHRKGIQSDSKPSLQFTEGLQILLSLLSSNVLVLVTNPLRAVP